MAQRERDLGVDRALRELLLHAQVVEAARPEAPAGPHAALEAAVATLTKTIAKAPGAQGRPRETALERALAEKWGAAIGGAAASVLRPSLDFAEEEAP
jgi:hypothetical protein